MLLRSSILCLLTITRATATPKDTCILPAGLAAEISTKFAGTRVVSLGDLDDYHRKLFKKDHGERCPGLAKVDFYGDHKPTWALVLISGENPKRKAELVVAHQNATGWDLRSLEKTDGTPIVWREPPGKYEGLYQEDQVIRATHPVIVFCGYESWAIVYAWKGREVQKVWISD